MRISVDKGDPGEIAYALARPVTVLLDGIARDNVITADEEQGYTVRFKTDERGRLVVNKERRALERETLYGTVRIEKARQHA